MTDEQLTPMEEAKLRVEQAKYAGTELEPYIVFIKRWDKVAEIHRFNPYMTVDGRLKEAKSVLEDGQAYSIFTFFNTGEADRVVSVATDTRPDIVNFPSNIIVPARSCLAILVDHVGGVYFGTASIGTKGMVDETNPLENAETSAVGRAFAFAGYGLIPGAGVASAEEVAGAIKREGAQNEEGNDWRSWPMSKLGQHQVPAGGWGRDRKFGGWTLEEVYADEDGHGAMTWAAGLSDPSGVTAMMAHYFNLREAQPGQVDIPDGMTQAEFDQQVTEEIEIPFDGEVILIAGRGVAADDLLTPAWTQWVGNLAAKNTGENRLFGHVNHLSNHLKKHFGVAKIVDLTGRKAAALVRYIQSGGKDKDPAYYSAKQDAEDLFGPMGLEELLRKAAPNLPPPYDAEPSKWLAETYEVYGIKEPLNAKQLDSMAKILQLIASGTINLREIAESDDEDDSMFRTLCNSLKKVAQNGE